MLPAIHRMEAASVRQTLPSPHPSDQCIDDEGEAVLQEAVKDKRGFKLEL